MSDTCAQKNCPCPVAPRGAHSRGRRPTHCIKHLEYKRRLSEAEKAKWKPIVFSSPELRALAESRGCGVGVFIPWDPSRTDKRAAKMGWITDARRCDIWQGNRSGDGYGRMRLQGRMVLVHRARYQIEIGPIPEGTELDHFACDNGAGGCCNPSHCRPVAGRENVLRGNSVSARHLSKAFCLKGHPLSGDNLDKSDRAKGHRKCRTCKNARRRVRPAAFFTMERVW